MEKIEGFSQRLRRTIGVSARKAHRVGSRLSARRQFIARAQLHRRVRGR